MNLELLPPPCVDIAAVTWPSPQEGGRRGRLPPGLAGDPSPQTHPVCLSLTCAGSSGEVGVRTSVAS